MSISFLPHGLYWIFGRHGNRTDRSPRRAFFPATTEVLETRLVMSTGMPAIQMLSATTTNSKSVTIDYQVNQVPDASNPIQFGIYRSSNGQFDSSDSLVDIVTLAGPGSGAQGAITARPERRSPRPPSALTNSRSRLPQGLPPFPEKPYVLVVADPSSALRNHRPSANRVVSDLYDRHRDPRRNPRSELETWTSLADRDGVTDEKRGLRLGDRL